MTSTTPKQIIILLQPDGDVVARHTELGQVVGEFRQFPSGEISFSYCQGEGRSWHVNRNIAAFRQAATVFNRFCQLHAEDEDTDDDAAWSRAAAQLSSELAGIEPLGDPETSLWSATIHDTEWGLLSLY
jgi:hypothetical protein